MQDEVAAILRKCGKGNFGSDPSQAMLFELHVANDFRAQWPGRMRQYRGMKSWIELLSDSSPADLRAALDHQRLESGFGEIEGRDQPVMTTADDDDIARVWHSDEFESAGTREGHDFASGRNQLNG